MPARRPGFEKEFVLLVYPDDHFVGLVYLGCCYRGKVTVEEHHYQGSRNEVRAAAREDALCLMADALAR